MSSSPLVYDNSAKIPEYNIMSFLGWLAKAQHPVLVVTMGNHDAV